MNGCHAAMCYAVLCCDLLYCLHQAGSTTTGSCVECQSGWSWAHVTCRTRRWCWHAVTQVWEFMEGGRRDKGREGLGGLMEGCVALLLWGGERACDCPTLAAVCALVDYELRAARLCYLWSLRACVVAAAAVVMSQGNVTNPTREGMTHTKLSQWILLNSRSVFVCV